MELVMAVTMVAMLDKSMAEKTAASMASTTVHRMVVVLAE